MTLSDDLLTLQNAIDKVVDTSGDIETTSNLLKENIAYVSVHNVSPEAHPDIREDLTKIPNVVTTPSLEGPLSIESGETHSYTIFSASLLVGIKITKFKIIKPDNTEIVLEGTAIINNSATFDLSLTGTRFEKQKLTLYAYDELGNCSLSSVVEFTITVNAAPDLSNLTCVNIPVYVNPGDSISFTFSGASDADIPYGDSLTYSIINSDLVFNKTTNIIEGETLTFTVPENEVRGSTAFFTIVATDTKAASATKVISTKINQLPVMTNFTQTLPQLINKNSTVSFRMSGATDPDGQAITYSIKCNNPNLIFSKTENITNLELLQLTVDSNANVGDAIEFTVIATDTLGSITSVLCNTSKVNIPPDVTNLQCTLPSIVIPKGEYDFVFNGAVDNEGSAITYALNCVDTNISFSKFTDIAENESVHVSVSNTSIRGTIFSIIVTATDAIGASTTKTFNYAINRLIDTTDAIFNIPEYIKPGSEYTTKITNVTDQDGQLINYSISSINENIHFSKTNNIHIGENITITTDSTLTRGELITFICDFDDGLELVTKSFTTIVNQLPSNVITATIPKIIKPSSTVPFVLNSTDPDNQTITYSLQSTDANITFSKIDNISPNETISLIANASVLRGTSVDIVITASDKIESVTKTETITINNLPSTILTHNIPNVVIPNSSNSISFSSTDLDSSQALIYSISSNNAGITFNKNNNISKDEIITMFISSNILRNTLVTLTITISDGLESVTTTTDITINELPDISELIIGGLLDILVPGNSYPISISGATDNNSQTLTYSISCNDNKITFSKSANVAENESLNMIIDSTISRNSTPTFTVTASDGLESVTKTFTSFINTIPVVLNVDFNSLPSILKPNTTYTNIKLSGATDVSSTQTLHYSISCDDSQITFSKSNNLTENETFDILVGNSIRNNTIAFTITVSDGLESANGVIKTRKINNLPLVTNLANTLPAIIIPNSTNTCILSGATDSDSQTLSYSISSNKSYISFSKSSGLASGESFNIIASASATRGDTVTFTVTVSDGLETATKTFTTVINSLPTATINHDIPYILIPNRTYTLHLLNTDINTAQVLMYSITSNNSGISFSKTTNILTNEAITMTVSDTVIRDSDITFTLTATDGLENVTNQVIRKINTLPDITELFLNNLPNIVIPNHSYTVNLSGATDINTTQVLTYNITSSDTSVTFSKSTGLTENEAFNISFGTGVIRNSSITLTVTVSDGLESVSTTFTTKVNTLPNLTNTTFNIPSIIKPDSTNTCILSGATDSDSQTLSYSISSNKSYISFSKSSGLASNESFNVIASASATRGETVTFTVTVSDGLETATKTFTTKINVLPITTNMIDNLPNILIPNHVYTFNISDITDANNQTLTYSINNTNEDITFSKLTNISIGENITLTTSSTITRNSNITFDIVVSDGLETVSATIFGIKINTLPVVTAVTANNLPSIVKPNSTTAINFTGATDSDSQTLTYSITSNKSYISFSKSTGLASNESFNVIASSSATRGDTVTFTVTVSDGLESVTTTFTTKINVLPSTTITHNVPETIVPGEVYPISISDTDSDNQTLTYAISSNNSGITFSKSTNIANNESINMIVDASTARSTTVTLTVSISDGLESANSPITTVVNDIPDTKNITANNLPSIVKPNSTTAINFTGATDNFGSTLTYAVTSSDTHITFSKTSNIAAGESINMIVAATTARNTTVTLTVSVSDGLETAIKTFSVFINTLPVMTAVTCSLPAIIKPSTVYDGIILTGMTDISAQTLTYSISCDNENITFSKSNNLSSNEAFTITTGAITRNTTLTFTVTGSDGLETATKTFTAKINNLPVSTNIINTLSSIIKPDSSNTCILSGATDSDSQTLTYAISADKSYITFSKSSGLASGESFNVIASSSATRGETVTFTVTVSDGLETATKTFTAKINTLPSTSVTNTLASIIIPSSTNACKLTSTDSDGQSLSYSITSNKSYISFSKSTGLASGESFNVIASSSATRGDTVTFTVTVSDGLESVTTTFTAKINTLPSTSVTDTLAAIIAPNSINSCTLTSTDSDGQTLTYAIISDKSYITFSKSSGLASGEAFNIIASASATRGDTVTFTVTVSDGLESVTTTFTTKINTLPTFINLVRTLPSIIIPNSTNTCTLNSIATDPDSQNVTYNISCDKSYISFSKSSGLAKLESFNVICTNGIRGETATFTVGLNDGLENNIIRDFTSTINVLPDLTNTVFSLPSIIKPSTTYTGMTLSGMLDTDNQTLTYSISCNNASITFSKSTGLTENEAFDVTIGAITRNTTLTFTVTGSDGLETATKTFTTKINNLPVSTNITNTLPAIIIPNSTNTCILSGATDSDSQTLTYSISADKSYISFSKSTGLASGESFNIIASSSATRGDTVTFTVTVSDGLETATKTFTAKINNLPTISALIFSLPSIIKPSTTYTGMTLSGGTDSDGQTVSYSISCNNAGISFSNSSNLVNNTAFNITTNSITRGTILIFTVVASDGLETATKTFTAKINTLPSTSVTDTLPAVIIPNSTNACTLTSTDSDSQTLSYSISSNKSYISFSKSSGLASGESFNIIASASATRGDTVTFTVTVSDGLESVTTTFTTDINTLPAAAGFTTTLPSIVKPNSTISFIMSGMSDSDSQTLNYAISSSDSHVTFSKSTGIAANESINMIISSTAIRGNNITLTITVSDGLENVSTTKTIKINTLPSTSVTDTLMSIIIPNSTNTCKLTSTDSDSQTLSYSISSNKSYISFSKSSGLTSGESFNIIASSSATRGDTVTFTVTVSDGLESVSTTFTTKINTLPSFTGFVETLPAVLIPNSTNPCTFNSIASDSDGQVLTYNISCDKSYISFSKSSGLAKLEQFNVIVAANATRGETITFTVWMDDGLENSALSTFTAKINTLPSTSVTDTLAAVIIPNSTNTCILSGATDSDSQTLSYSISSNKSYISFSKSSGLASGESFNIIASASATRGETVTFTVTVSDGLETSNATFTTKINTLPSFTNLVRSLPFVITPNSTNTCTLNSIATDPDSQNVTYNISCDKSYISFSKSTGLAKLEQFIVTCTNGVRGETATFRVTLSDGLEESAITTFTAKINTLPSTSVTDTLPAIIIPNSINSCTLTSTDSDSQTLSYSITSNKSYISFSKSTGLASNESFNIIASSSATRGDTVTFTVTVSDGLESVTTTFTTKINTLPVLSGLVETLDSILIPGSTNTCAFNSIASDPDGQVITYKVSCDKAYISFSKSTGLAKLEQFNVIVASNATRGETATFFVCMFDGLENSTLSTFTAKINTLPSTSITNTLPSIIAPNRTTPCTLTSTDSDSQTLSYSITSNKSYITFSKSTGLASGESFNVIASSSATRGDTVTFTVTVSDGLETSNATFTTKINTLPTLTGLVETLASTLTPGSTNTCAFNGIASDPDGQVITYKVSCDKAYISFSKSSGLAKLEQFNVIVASNATLNETATFFVCMFDGLENSTLSTFTATISPIYTIDTPSILSPTENQVLTNDAITFTFSAINVTASS